MDNFTLTATPFLGGYSRDFGATSLTEITDISLLSIAQPLDGRAGLTKAINATWGLALPDPGHSALSKDSKTTVLCLGADTFFAIIEGNDTARAAAQMLGSFAYTTDQSDNWVALRLSGELAHAALERICPIDLHPTVFPTGAFARTSMEHLGVIILRESENIFLLLSASSSAGSFLHAIETSLIYVT